MTDTRATISGQLYVREAGEVNGKRLVMVVGVSTNVPAKYH
jgi:hypothetical protein